jgi:ferredoxin-NADP reductase
VKGQAQMRRYSLVGLPEGKAWTIAVKRLALGRGGSKAMWDLDVGATLTVRGPYRHFALQPGGESYLLIAAGIGVTPLLGMAQHLAASRFKPRLRMLYAARSAEELPYLEPLRQVLGDRLNVFLASDGRKMNLAEEIAAEPIGTQAYACGPVSMLEALRAAWVQAGHEPSQLRYETFGASDQEQAHAFRVLLPRHHLDLEVPVESTLLDALSAAGVATLSNCRRGECGLCAMDVTALQGSIDHRDVFLSAAQKERGDKICVCVSRVTGSITLDSAYRDAAA